jgi:hypothetical protein
VPLGSSRFFLDGDAMMTITQAIRGAARLLGTTLYAMATEAQVRPEHLGSYLDCLEDVDRMLATRGLRLAVVWMDHPTIEIPDQRVLAATEQEHLARGEVSVRHRLARLMRIEVPMVVRTLERGNQLGGADSGAAARRRLWDHRLDPERHPLPPPLRRQPVGQLVPETSGETRQPGSVK